MSASVSLSRHAVLALRSLVLGAVLWLGALVITILWAAPPLDRSLLELPQNVVVLDRNGDPLYRFFTTDDRSSLEPEQIPDRLRDAIVAVEDRRFFTRRSCIDPRAILRATIYNLRTDDLQGGSTITQQLVRNIYLSPTQTLHRKLQELWLACRLERTLTRDEILTLYMNRVAFGGAVYGVEQAAQTYFGKHASELTLPEISVIAALPQRPSSFAPGGLRERTTVDHAVIRQLRTGEMAQGDIPPSAVRRGLLGRSVPTPQGYAYVGGRADAVLTLLEREGHISQTEAAQARAELRKLKLVKQVKPIVASHFSQWMRSQAEAILGSVEQPSQWERSGLIVHTTIDDELQRIAEESVLNHLATVHAQGGKDIALVALDRETREILAYVGNVSTTENMGTTAIDMVRAPRQPGSSIKPLVYSFAFERGWTPDTFVSDSAITIGGFRPKNYEGGFLGRMTVRDALAKSRNIPAIRAFLAFNDEDGLLALMSRAGAPTPQAVKRERKLTDQWFTYGWPISIGSAELPLLELTTAYATIADHGVAKDAQAICRITDRQGSPLLTPPRGAGIQAIQKEAAMGVDSILRDSSARRAGFWRDILTIPGQQNGAKTGTSNVCLQQSAGGQCLSYAANTVWTLGYTDDLVVGVLVGNADNAPMSDTADGLTVAAPIWHEFLERAENTRRTSGACR